MNNPETPKEEVTAPVAQTGVVTPLPHQINELRDHISVYVNKFTASVLKHAMVKLGFSVEYGPDNKDDRFVGSYVMTIHDVAALHNLLGQMLNAYQQQQQLMIQQAQGKVNPQFLEQLKAMQKAHLEGDKPATPVPANDVAKTEPDVAA